MSNELCFQSAVQLASLVRSGELSARELLDAHLDQIDRVNPQVNAIVTLTDDLARKQAAAADEAQARGESLGPLHGVPVAHKDLVATAGIRTTWGSPIYSDFVPDEDALIIQRLKSAGVVQLGKTNVPEFGAGSQTFNPVFGACLNPYDTSRTCGG
ncbi:MAG: amidase family protein, partial [Planctomycetota bacterium]|nr:amidase family protein [Planctomycetota bacterium]